MTTPTEAFNEWLFGSDGVAPNARHPSLVKLIRMGWDANAKHEQDMRAINHKMVYICEDHDSLCPIRDATSIIVADDKDQARRELDEQELDSWQKLIRVLTHEIMNSVTPVSSLSQAINEMLVHMIDLANWYFGPIHDPFAYTLDLFIFICPCRYGIDSPVNEHAESCFTPPLHPFIPFFFSLF